jgi:hypothetical protein
MALIDCRECGAAISSKATACPSCGAPQVQHRYLPALMLLIGGGIAVLIGMNADIGHRTSPRSYTGRLRVDASTEYVLANVPSSLDGSCSGWNAVYIQKPGEPATRLPELLCWRRAGENVETTDPSGRTFHTAAANLISD